METKHTKGEWTIDKKASLRVHIDGKTIANCGGYISNESLEEAQANAKLIAAAPELLEALIDLKWLIDNGATNEELLESVFYKANKAITKATE